MTWNTHHDSLLYGRAANSAVILGAQRLFRLRFSLHSTPVQLGPILDDKSYWTLKCVSQVFSGTPQAEVSI